MHLNSILLLCLGLLCTTLPGRCETDTDLYLEGSGGENQPEFPTDDEDIGEASGMGSGLSPDQFSTTSWEASTPTTSFPFNSSSEAFDDETSFGDFARFDEEAELFTKSKVSPVNQTSVPPSIFVDDSDTAVVDAATDKKFSATAIPPRLQSTIQSEVTSASDYETKMNRERIFVTLPNPIHKVPVKQGKVEATSDNTILLDKEVATSNIGSFDFWDPKEADIEVIDEPDVSSEPEVVGENGMVGDSKIAKEKPVEKEEVEKEELEDEVEDVDSASLATSTHFLAAVIVGGCIGLLFAICVIMLLVYRMRKKDEGSYALEYGLDGKKAQSSYEYTKGVDSKEYYA